MLEVNDIILINKALNGRLLSYALLASIFSSVDYYSTTEEKIASVFRSLAKNHAFTDGNKRTAVLVLYLLCKENKLALPKDSLSLLELTLDIAEKHYEVKDIAFKLFGKK